MRNLPLVSLLVLSLIPCRATADEPPDPRAAAKQHYEAGEQDFRLGDFDHAIEEWRKSFKLSNSPTLLYNIAQAYRQKGDSKQALFFYQQFLATGPSGAPRDVAQKRVEELKAALAAQQHAQTAPPQRPEPPQTAPASSSPTQPPSANSATVSIEHQAPPRRPWIKKPLPWVLLGVGVAGVAVGGALLGIAAHQGDLASKATTMSAFDMHHANDLNDQKGGWPVLAVGAASLVVGGVVIAIEHRKDH